MISSRLQNTWGQATNFVYARHSICVHLPISCRPSEHTRHSIRTRSWRWLRRRCHAKASCLSVQSDDHRLACECIRRAHFIVLRFQQAAVERRLGASFQALVLMWLHGHQWCSSTVRDFSQAPDTPLLRKRSGALANEAALVSEFSGSPRGGKEVNVNESSAASVSEAARSAAVLARSATAPQVA